MSFKRGFWNVGVRAETRGGQEGQLPWALWSKGAENVEWYTHSTALNYLRGGERNSASLSWALDDPFPILVGVLQRLCVPPTNQWPALFPDHMMHRETSDLCFCFPGTLMCYGQTGAGKTHTITGTTENYTHRGIIPRALQQVLHSPCGGFIEMVPERTHYHTKLPCCVVNVGPNTFS